MSDAGKWSFEWKEGEEQTLETAVLYALGAASVCWEPMDGTGVFQSDRAIEISDALIEFIETKMHERSAADARETAERQG